MRALRAGARLARTKGPVVTMSKSDADAPDALVALREVAESLLLTQRAMGNDVADMASAVTENTKVTEQVSNLLIEAVSRLGAAIDKLDTMEERLGRYLQDAAKQQSGIREVDSRLKAVELRLVGGSGS